MKKIDYENKETALKMMRKDGMNLRFFTKFQSDSEVCKIALLNTKNSMVHINLELLFKDEEFWLFVFNLYLKDNLKG